MKRMVDLGLVARPDGKHEDCNELMHAFSSLLGTTEVIIGIGFTPKSDHDNLGKMGGRICTFLLAIL